MEPLISVDVLAQMWDQEEVIILDASPTSNKSGLVAAHPGKKIKGARIFNLKKVFSDLESAYPNMLPQPKLFEEAAQALGINNESMVVVYDNLGIYTAPRVRWMFRVMGFNQIAVLDGGLSAWIDSGHPVEAMEAPNTYYKGNFEAQYKLNLIKSMVQVEDSTKHQAFMILDARSKGRFEGTAPEPRADLPSGSIPGSLNLPFTSVLNNGKMKTKEELRSIFGALPIKDYPLVFSCGSGLTACIVLLAGELVLENEMAVYDGSWTEWAMCKLV